MAYFIFLRSGLLFILNASYIMALDTERLLNQAAAAAGGADQPAAPALSILTFMLGGERFGIPLAEAREVARPGPVTPVPGLPPVLLGAVNLHGEIVPVADLRPLLNLPPGRAAPAAGLVVVGRGGERVALHVDAIGDMFEVATSVAAASAAGLVVAQTLRPAGGLVSLLDVGRILAALQDA